MPRDTVRRLIHATTSLTSSSSTVPQDDNATSVKTTTSREVQDLITNHAELYQSKMSQSISWNWPHGDVEDSGTLLDTNRASSNGSFKPAPSMDLNRGNSVSSHGQSICIMTWLEGIEIGEGGHVGEVPKWGREFESELLGIKQRAERDFLKIEQRVERECLEMDQKVKMKRLEKKQRVERERLEMVPAWREKHSVDGVCACPREASEPQPGFGVKMARSLKM